MNKDKSMTKMNKYEEAFVRVYHEIDNKLQRMKLKGDENNEVSMAGYIDLEILEELVDLYTQANKSAPKAQVDKIVDRYNSIQGVPQVVKLTDSRRRTLNARIKDYGIDTIYDMLGLVEQSDFLRGNVTQFSANWDWIMNPNNFVKILEGKYFNKVEETKSFHERDDII